MEEIKMKSKGSDVNTPTEDKKVTGNITDEEIEYVEGILKKYNQNKTSALWAIVRIVLSLLIGFTIGQLIVTLILNKL